jgi:hypothetical protein
VPLEPSSVKEQEQQRLTAVAMPNLSRPKKSTGFYKKQAMNYEFFKGFCVGFLALAGYSFVAGFVQAWLKDRKEKNNV